MGRSNPKQSKGSKQSAETRQVERSSKHTGSVGEQMDRVSLRSSVVVAVLAGASLLAFMYVFLMTDVPDRIARGMQKPVYAAQNHTPAKQDVDKQFHIAVFGGTVSKSDFIDYLDSLNDEDFTAFMNQVADKYESDGKLPERVQSMLDSLADGQSVNKQEFMQYLDSLDGAEFNAFIQAVVKAVSPDQLDKLTFDDEAQATPDIGEGPLKPTLEDAYAEAERLYPGRVDGSKRLKLIQELNGTGYLYYVAEQGDTLIKLSNAFDVSLGELVELNGIHDADKIRAGEILLFPTDTEQPDLSK